jgi:phosphate transport system substrate-binding protein
LLGTLAGIVFQPQSQQECDSMFKPTQVAVALAGFTVAGLAFSGAAQAQIVKIDGSSTVYPITEAVAEEFQKAKKNAIKVTVGISGTGGGFKKFCRGEIDLSGASRPILKKEMDACKEAGIQYYELPVAFDALTIVANPKNAFLKAITVEELKKIWEPAAQGTVTKWNQVNPAWPDAPIKLFGDNVLVQGVARDVNAIGYFGYAYYAENKNKLAAVPVVEKAGKPAVAPSEETVLKGTYQPLSRPIFIYVSAKSIDKPEVKEFIDYYMAHGAQLAKEVKYVPLPANAYKVNVEHLAKKKLGTVFGGVPEVGITIEELQRREAKM